MLNQVLTSAQVAVVIPARNEAAAIRGIVLSCLQHVLRVIVIDDASTDDTSGQLHGLPITLLRSDVQLGKGGALLKGFREALQQGARAVLTLDGDGQHDPHDLPAFIAAAGAHPHHLITGARLKQLHCAPRKRLMANRIADFCIAWAAGQALRDSQCGMRLYPAELLRAVPVRASVRQSFVFESEILIDAVQAGFPVVSVPIAAHYPPHARPSHFRPVRDIWRITCMVSGKIIPRGMYLAGLWRSLRQQPLIVAMDASSAA